MNNKQTIEEITRQSLEDKLALLLQERDNFVTNANSQVAAYNGAIQVLEDVLGKGLPKESEDDGEHN